MNIRKRLEILASFQATATEFADVVEFLKAVHATHSTFEGHIGMSVDNDRNRWYEAAMQACAECLTTLKKVFTSGFVQRIRELSRLANFSCRFGVPGDESVGTEHVSLLGKQAVDSIDAAIKDQRQKQIIQMMGAVSVLYVAIRTVYESSQAAQRTLDLDKFVVPDGYEAVTITIETDDDFDRYSERIEAVFDLVKIAREIAGDTSPMPEPRIEHGSVDIQFGLNTETAGIFRRLLDLCVKSFYRYATSNGRLQGKVDRIKLLNVAKEEEKKLAASGVDTTSISEGIQREVDRIGDTFDKMSNGSLGVQVDGMMITPDARQDHLNRSLSSADQRKSLPPASDQNG